ncbi:MAG: hypothetical protein GXY76_13075 [Chloroflexi bacterium]|nr:hypothetical protein [Chloroflexota bacterium]
MDLYYYHDLRGNFGDDLNAWLWPRLLPLPISECFDDRTLFLGIGTILNQHVPAKPQKKVVFGAGHGYGLPPTITPQWRFYCVRGPLTANALGIPAHLAICDSSILIREFFAPATSRFSCRACFMPHHWNAEADALSTARQFTRLRPFVAK